MSVYFLLCCAILFGHSKTLFNQMLFGFSAHIQGRPGSSNKHWLSRLTGPISSGVTRNLGNPSRIFMYSRPSQGKALGPPLPFQSLHLCPRLCEFVPGLAPSSHVPYPPLVNGVKSFDVLQHLTWRPTWTRDQPAHLVSARQPGRPVRP